MTADSRMSEVLDRWQEAAERGEMLSLDELCRDCPELRSQLERQISGLRRMALLLGPASEATGSPPAPSLPGLSTVTPPTGGWQPSHGECHGEAVPGFEVLGVLGRGGMGVVYRARQAHLNREVALKMILAGSHASPEEHARFLAEAEVVASLRHPGIVQIHEFGTHDGRPYFALELCPGGSLAQRLAGTPLPPRQGARIIEQVARAVQAAHDKGVVHRDLKPGNILLDAAGQPRVSDFGLARRLEGGHGLTQTNAVMGTPSYMAPEQARNSREVGPAADVYALGAILYECLTGRPPFLAATAYETIGHLLADEPVPPRQLNAEVPADLEVICLKCLEKLPGRRYGSSEELAEDLRRWQAGEPIVARPVGSAERLWKLVRRRPLISGLVAATALALVLGTVVSTYFGLVARGQEKLARV